MEEKSLIKKETINIFDRIILFFKGLFCKKRTNESNIVNYNNIKNNTIDELKKENKIMAMQRDYEKGVIKKDELSENEKQELLSLYQKQVKCLEDNIECYKRIMEDYKNKIIEKRKKLQNTN